MTVEEIEIIVTAQAEEALKEFQKFLPAIKQTIKQAQEAFSKVDTKAMTNKLQQTVNLTKKKMQNLKKSSENNEIAIKVNNKDAEKQISQLEKEINSLQSKINASQTSLKSVNVKADTIKEDTSLKERLEMATRTGYKNNYTKQEYNTLDNNISKSLNDNSDYTYAIKQQEILKKNIEEYKTQIDVAKKKLIELGQVTLPKRTITGAKTMNVEKPDISIWDVLKNKIGQIKPAMQAVKQCFKNVFSGEIFKNEDPFDLGESGNQIRLIEFKIDKLEAKIKGVQKGKIELSDEDIAKAEVELDRLYNQKEKLENESKGESKGNFFSGFFSSLKKATPSMNSISGITIKIRNQIKQWGGGVKNGLGHVLKYAGALFSLRSIYSTLSGCAQSWLSSQNSGAKQLSANIDYMKYAMGSALAPVIQFITNLVYQLMKAIQSVAYALTGVNIFAKASASSYSSMAKSAGKAKDATKQLAGVHSEINNVQTNKSGSSGGAGTPSFDLSGLDNTPNSIIDAIKSGNWYEVGATIGKKLNEAMNSIPWDKIQSTAKSIGTNIAQFLNGFIATSDWKQVGNTFAQGINTVIYLGQSFVKTFKWENFGKAMGDGLTSFIKNIDWRALGDTLSSGIKGIFDTITGFCETFDWSVVINGLLDFIKGFDWNGVSDAIFKALGSACASLVNLGMVIGEKINEALDSAKSFFQKKIEECGGNVVLGILKGIGDAVIGIGQWIYEHIFKPFIEGFKNAFGIHSPSTVMEEQGNFIIEGLKNGLIGIWDAVAGIFNGFAENIKNKFNKIKDEISEWAENVKSKVKECWDNVSNKVKENVDNVKNSISKGFNNAQNTISNWGNNVKSKISECWSNASNTVRDKVNILKNNISIGLNNAKTIISSWGDNIKTTFINLGQNATTWGRDLTENMASGIRNTAHKVGSAVQSVASKIKGFLGFSEPEEGPLSNFHTYMPDMIDLMVKGIKDNIGKVKNEIGNLAGTMSCTINTEAVTGIPSTNPTIKPINIKANRMLDTLSEAMAYKRNENSDRPINLTVNVGSTKLGQILLDNLRDMKRQSGKDIEALVGG